MGLNAHHKDRGLNPAVGSVQNEARIVDVHSCTSAAAKIHGTRSALGRAGPEAGSDFRFVLETILSAAVGCGCDPDQRILQFQSFLLTFQGCSCRVSAMVTMGGEEEKGFKCSLCFFHTPQHSHGLAHMDNASFLGSSINPSLHSCFTLHVSELE